MNTQRDFNSSESWVAWVKFLEKAINSNISELFTARFYFLLYTIYDIYNEIFLLKQC